MLWARVCVRTLPNVDGAPTIIFFAKGTVNVATRGATYFLPTHRAAASDGNRPVVSLSPGPAAP